MWDSSEELATLQLYLRSNCKSLNPSLLRGAVTHVTVCLHEYVSSWAASIPNSEDINLFGSL